MRAGRRNQHLDPHLQHCLSPLSYHGQKIRKQNKTKNCTVLEPIVWISPPAEHPVLLIHVALGTMLPLLPALGYTGIYKHTHISYALASLSLKNGWWTCLCRSHKSNFAGLAQSRSAEATEVGEDAAERSPPRQVLCTGTIWNQVKPHHWLWWSQKKGLVLYRRYDTDKGKKSPYFTSGK